jgi:phage terminase Nu1 subunit (DNA packaging protein)
VVPVQKVTQRDMAEHIDLAERQVRKYVAAGVIEKPAHRGQWDLAKNRVLYIRHLRGLAAGWQSKTESGEVLDLTEERAKLARVQTEAMEIKNATARRELIPADLVIDHWGQQTIATKSHLRSIPHQFKTAVPHLAAEEVELLRALIDRALNELADGLPTTDASEGELDQPGSMEATA